MPFTPLAPGSTRSSRLKGRVFKVSLAARLLALPSVFFSTRFHLVKPEIIELTDSQLSIHRIHTPPLLHNPNCSPLPLSIAQSQPFTRTRRPKSAHAIVWIGFMTNATYTMGRGSSDSRASGARPNEGHDEGRRAGSGVTSPAGEVDNYNVSTKRRRLSLKSGPGVGSPEKKARVVGVAGAQRGEDIAKGPERHRVGLAGRVDSNPDDAAAIQQPSTASSSNFDRSRSSRSPSSTSASDLDHRNDSTSTTSRSRFESSSSRSQPAEAMPNLSVSSQSTSNLANQSTRRQSTHPQSHSQPPSSTASTSSMQPTWRTSSVERDQPTPTQHHSYQPPSSVGSRLPSPPPSFNLSSGQPLLNPPLKTQAAFVGKLYAMLEDEEIKKTGLIYWSSDGTIFTCPNPTEFSKSVTSSIRTARHLR